jgi:hypothetical protein
MKYTADEKTKVGHLLERGWTYDQILAVKDFAHFDRNTLRAMKCNAAKGKKTQRNATQTDASAQRKKNQPETPKKGFLVKSVVAKSHPAYLLYFASVGLACNAVANTLQGVGLPVAFIFGGAAFIALYGVATARGAWLWLNVAMMLFVEVVCAAVHLHWSNAALWANVNELPFNIWANKYRNDLGEVVMLYGGSDTDKPFLVACGIAVVLFVCSLFAGLTAYSNRE